MANGSVEKIFKLLKSNLFLEGIMENQSKNIFYIACALGVFTYSADKLYKIWHMHQDQAY
jgi:hypothetical protein